MRQSSVHGTLISDGYAAFNADDWDAVRALFCADTPGADGKIEFPAWHLMHHAGVLTGRETIIGYLQELRGDAAKANLLGVADHGHKSVTLDITTGGPEGPHACADEVEFDEAGLIKVFKHCAAATHIGDDHDKHSAS